MVVLMLLIVGNPLRAAEGHDHGQDGADGDDGDCEVSGAGRVVPIALAEDDHGHILRDRVYSAKGRRTPQHDHQAADVATRESLVATPRSRSMQRRQPTRCRTTASWRPSWSWRHRFALAAAPMAGAALPGVGRIERSAAELAGVEELLLQFP
jgi:hypothetical protein